MLTVLLVIHLLIAIALIAVVLVQRSEGGGLGIGGGGGGMGGFMTARGTGNLFTKVTWSLAAAFMAVSLILTTFGGRPVAQRSIIDNMTPVLPAPEAPASPAVPQAPTAPAAPIAR